MNATGERPGNRASRFPTAHQGVNSDVNDVISVSTRSADRLRPTVQLKSGGPS